MAARCIVGHDTSDAHGGTTSITAIAGRLCTKGGQHKLWRCSRYSEVDGHAGKSHERLCRTYDTIGLMVGKDGLGDAACSDEHLR